MLGNGGVDLGVQDLLYGGCVVLRVLVEVLQSFTDCVGVNRQRVNLLFYPLGGVGSQSIPVKEDIYKIAVLQV